MLAQRRRKYAPGEHNSIELFFYNFWLVVERGHRHRVNVLGKERDNGDGSDFLAVGAVFLVVNHVADAGMNVTASCELQALV